jgi:photosystem II stability/assembly factor-like uncharacterized protein
MRRARAFVLATLMLGLASRPIHGQPREEETPALTTLHMVDDKTGWAYGGGVLRSTDGGINWRDITPINSSGQRIGFSNITALSHQVAWVIPAATNVPAKEIFRTSDGGLTWGGATIDGGLTWGGATIQVLALTSLSFINPREGWLLASFGAAAGSEAVEAYRSTDGGGTWISVGPLSGLPNGGNKTRITFLNSTTGWITGVTLQYDTLYLYVTHDSGRTWRPQVIPLPPEVIPHWRGVPHQPPPKFFTARDGILPVFYEIYAGPNDSLHSTGETAVAIYATHDGGMTWTYSSVKRVNGSYLILISFADTNHGWLMNGSNLYVTSDGGRRWTTIHPSQLPFDTTQLEFISPQVGWAISKVPSLNKTLDGGLTWAPLPYRIQRQ